MNRFIGLAASLVLLIPSITLAEYRENSLGGDKRIIFRSVWIQADYPVTSESGSDRVHKARREEFEKIFGGIDESLGMISMESDILQPDRKVAAADRMRIALTRQLRKRGVDAAYKLEREHDEGANALRLNITVRKGVDGLWYCDGGASVWGAAGVYGSDDSFATILWSADWTEDWNLPYFEGVKSDALAKEVESVTETLLDLFVDAYSNAHGSANSSGAAAPWGQSDGGQYYSPTAPAIRQAAQWLRPILVELRVTVKPKVVRTRFAKQGLPNYVFFVDSSTGVVYAVSSQGNVHHTNNNGNVSPITNLLQQIFTVRTPQQAKQYAMTHLMLVRARNKNYKFNQPVSLGVSKTASGGLRVKAEMPIASSKIAGNNNRAFEVDLQFDARGKLERPPSTYRFAR